MRCSAIKTPPFIEEEFMSRTKAPAPLSRIVVLGLAGAIAAAATLVAAEFMPARSLGPIAGAPAAPSRADLDYSHGAFEHFRDRPDDPGASRIAGLAAATTSR
jgi:hypothetical protein